MSSSVPPTAGPKPTERPEKGAADSRSEAPVVSDAAKQRAAQAFEHANRCLKKGDYEYAHDLFSQCVAADPSVLVYVQHFRANLAQLFPELSQPGAAKKGGKFAIPRLTGVGKGAVAKAAGKGALAEAFTAGCAALRKSPADTVALCEMAAACGELGHTEVQLYYLRWAMDLAPADVEINRRAAAVLEAMNEFDQAIGCWKRIKKDKPNDEEANKEINRLSAEQTIDQGGYDPALLKGEAGEIPVAAPPSVASVASRNPVNASNTAPPPLPIESTADEPAAQTEETLRAAIDSDPENPAPYVALADYSEGVGRLQDAERLLRKALELSGGGDLPLLVKLEEVYLRRMRERSAAANRKASQAPGPETSKEAQRAYREAAQAEVEVFEARAERSPDDPELRYELGIRLKLVGRHREAIEPLQAARAIERRLAETQLHLGECFQHIGQNRLAIKSYEASLAACSGSDWTDLRKLACYRAGVLALGMKDLETAENLLTDLAAADFGYRDVAERLDKLARIRDAT